MKAKLTNTTVKALKPQERTYDVRDTEIKGFLLRIYPSGERTYYLQYRNREGTQKHYKIGPGSLKPAKARYNAGELAGDVAKGIDIQKVRQYERTEAERQKFRTLRGFLDLKYEPWISEHRKTGAESVARIRRNFKDHLDKPLMEINQWLIENWRRERLKSGVSRATVNRDINTLKAALSRAVEWEIIRENPLAKVKPEKLDSMGKVRYLSDDEEKALRAALIERDIRIKTQRVSYNEWLIKRGHEPYPDLTDCHYGDHLTPIVLLTLNTGLRRGEIFNLRWPDINFQTKTLTVQGATAKSGETRHIPLNSESIDVLKKWLSQSVGTEWVFPGKEQEQLNTIKTAWRGLISKAKTKDFRFHDLRHSFASKLVMRGIPLNTVRDLLGHSDLKTTLRYAHLAPDHKADAVEALNN